MRAVPASILVLGLLLLPLAFAPSTGAAAPVALVGSGNGQAAFTFCPVNNYQLELAGTQAPGGGWTINALLVSAYPACFSPPQHTFTGSWDPALGGCGLHDAQYQLCLVSTGPTAARWSLCYAREPVCSELNEVYRGTMTLAVA